MDSTDDLLAELLDRPAETWRAELERVCHVHPARATELRRRFAHLERCGVTEPAALPALLPGQPPQRCGPYRLLRRLGEGGMGTVWLAMHEALGREVAIKMLRPERLWFENARERFQREVEAVARLRHSGCVAIHEVGEADHVPYFAMEYVAGANCEQILAALRARRPPVSPANSSGNDLLAVLRQGGAQVDSDASALFTEPWVRTAVRTVLAATEALAHAHARGVVHRDLKPSNLMITPEGRVVVIDFGLAVAAGSSNLTREGSQLGSVPYMAPEQLRGDAKAIGARTDVYALGVCLYELLAQAPPFPPGDEQQLRTAILAGVHRPLAERNPAVSRDLTVVVARAMHLDPESRYASALELAADLMAVLEDRSIQARRDALGARLLRWSRRRPALATGIGLLLLVALLLPTAISLGIAQQRDYAQAAERLARRREYSANIAAAGAALLAGNGNQAQLHLAACPAEVRGFEWAHLSLALDASFLVIPVGKAAVTAVAVSPDGTQVAAGDAEGRITLFALRAGQLVRQFQAAGKATVSALGFDDEGTQLFAIDGEQDLRAYAVATGQVLRERLRTAKDEHLQLAEPVDRIIASRGGGRLATLDAGSFETRSEITLELHDWPTDNRFAVRGNDVIAGGRRGISIWNLLDGRRANALPHSTAMQVLGVSQRTPTIAGRDGHSLVLWTGDENNGSVLGLDGRQPVAVLFPRAGRFVVAPCSSGEIMVRDPETNHWRTLCGHRGAVTSAACVPHANTFVTGGADGTVRLWSASACRHQVDLKGAGWGRSLAVGAQQQLFTGDDNAVVWAVDPATGAAVWHSQHPHWVNAIAVVEPLLIASVGNRLWFWSTADGASHGHLDLPSETGRATRIAVDQTGPRIAVAGQAGHVTLVDPVARTVLQCQRVHEGMVTEVAFAASGQLFSCGLDGAVFTLAPGASTPTLLCRTRAACRTMALCGSVFYTSEQATLAATGVVAERDTRTGATLRTQQVTDAVVVMRVMEPERLVLGTETGLIAFWDRTLLAPILDFQLFTQRVRNLQVDPRGEWVAAIGSGGDPRILRASPGVGDAALTQQRLRIADLRDRIGAALLATRWLPQVVATIAQDQDLDGAARSTALSLLPPASYWDLGLQAHELGTYPAPDAAVLDRLQTLSVALQEALQTSQAEHALLIRIGYALVSIRLHQPGAALAACAEVSIDAELGPADNRGQFLPALHFARGMAHHQLGAGAAAQLERATLAKVAAGAFAGNSRTHLLLRELDEALR